MNSKQLANVLIKILGLSIAIHTVPLFISNLISAMLSSFIPYSASARVDGMLIRSWTYVLTAGAEACAAIILILASEWVAGMLFPSENHEMHIPPATQQ